MTGEKLLDAETVIAINEAVGGPGAAGLKLPQLDSAIMKPAAGFGDVEAYPTVWDKAAALLQGLARAHAFLDGNKRTAWIACTTFLRLNGTPLRADRITDPVGEVFVLGVTSAAVDHQLAVQWLRDGIGTDFAASEDEAKGWVDPEKVHYIVDMDVYSGRLTLTVPPDADSPGGGDSIPVVYVKFKTLEPGNAELTEEKIDHPPRRHTFAMAPEGIDYLCHELQAVKGRFGTLGALPGAVKPPNPKRARRTGKRKGKRR